MMDMYVKFMSVGLVGPGGGIYSIIEDAECKVYFQKTDLEPNNSGYMQFCFSVCGPCRAQRWDIFNYRGCCVKSIFSEN